MGGTLASYGRKLEVLAQDLGLEYYPVHFEEVPDSFMMEIAIYGLPVRMPHWSFGVRYIYQLVQHRMGHSRLFEVVFPGNPGRAYLAKNNSLQENTLVMAHVLGHADFSKNNALFRRSQEEGGYRIVEQAAAHARQIGSAIEEHGQERVEKILDAALALEAHIDIFKGLPRQKYPEYLEERPPGEPDPFLERFHSLPGDEGRASEIATRVRASVPPHPERDLLWFIANYAPELEDWERDIFLAVREESFYFYPVFACQIMNEGWASYWHARLLREADWLPQSEYLDAVKTHSDVVRPHAAGNEVSLQVNPYHLGFSLWEKIVEDKGMEAACEIRAQDDDFSFIRNHLTEDLAEELDLFKYDVSKDGTVTVAERDIDALRDALLAPKYNFGAPAVLAVEVSSDGGLQLHHEHQTDGRGLDLDRSSKVLEYVHRVWRRPVTLSTVNAKGATKTLTYPVAA
ncbi:MAG: SpoVR family protein [Gammaproteobacteria bacterium]|nr:SpoVR family protein [Gammaproteobacteria bacterium]